MIPNRLQSIGPRSAKPASLAKAREFKLEGTACIRLEDPVKGPTHEAKVEDGVLGACFDALQQNGVDDLGRQAIHRVVWWVGGGGLKARAGCIWAWKRGNVQL